MANKSVSITVAAPVDGEGIERLNQQKYADNILASLTADYPEYTWEVEVIDNDGTAVDDFSQVPDDVDVSDAISGAFADETSYDDAE